MFFQKHFTARGKYSRIPNGWCKARLSTRLGVSDYETCLNNWRLSGNHGDFGDESGNSNRIPFVNFVNNKNILLYSHELVYEHQDTFSNLTSNCLSIESS